MTFQVDQSDETRLEDGALVSIPYKPERVAFAEQLKARPGAVAVIARTNASKITNLQRRGTEIRAATHRQTMFAPAGHFETTVRVIFDTAYLLVRYVGDGVSGITEPETADEAALKQAQERARTRIHLVATWYGREIFWEEHSIAPNHERLAELRFQHRMCQKDRNELPQLRIEAVRRIAQLYTQKLGKLLEEDGHAAVSDADE